MKADLAARVLGALEAHEDLPLAVLVGTTVQFAAPAFWRATGLEPATTVPTELAAASHGRRTSFGAREIVCWWRDLGNGAVLLVVDDRTEFHALEERLWDGQTRLSTAYVELSVNHRETESALARVHDREARLRGLFDAVLDGLIVIDGKGLVESMNPAAQRMFGWPAAEVVGKNVSMLMPQPYRGEHDGYLHAYRETRVPKIIGKGREVSGLRRDGTTFPLDLSVTEVKTGEETRFIGLIRDLTARKELEQWNQALLAREAHQQGRAEVSAGMLHDIGNVMTGIAARAVDANGAIERSTVVPTLTRTVTFLKDNQPQLEAALGAQKGQALVTLVASLATGLRDLHGGVGESLGKVLAFLTHAQELLTTHRAYSGVGSGPARERFDVTKGLFDAQMLMSDGVAKRSGVITVKADESLPRVELERGKLMQVLINLIRNSIEAFDSEASDRPLHVALTASLEGPNLLVQVRDNGPGFSPAVGAQLFEDGFSTKRRASGIGLGASRRVIQSLGGSLELTSPGQGGGAVASIRIPVEASRA